MVQPEHDQIFVDARTPVSNDEFPNSHPNFQFFRLSALELSRALAHWVLG